MKKLSKYLSIALSALMLTSAFAGCNPDDGASDIELDSDGKPRPTGSGETKVNFWGTGGATEKQVFTNLVAAFNEEYDGTIEVKYIHQPDNGYEEACSKNLSLSKAQVDVLYVKEPSFKGLAAAGYLEPLDSYIANSTEVNVEEMWETSINRYKYDVNTTTADGPDAHYWGIPKDIGPTVLYYNETFFNNAGVKVISVEADKLDEFNNGAADSRGKTKAQYEIPAGYVVKEMGFFTDSNGQQWFNNQVPMSWKECRELAVLVQASERTLQSDNNFYGYFTEWWFNYGWSVGGDCIEFVETSDPTYNGGYYDFTLMDATKNYIVADDFTGTFTVNGNDYKAGEIIEWADKLVDPKAQTKVVREEVIAAKNAGTLNELPSQRDAFVEFVRVGQKSNVEVENGLMGYGICPDPDSIGGDSGKITRFASGKLGMLVDGRWSVVDFRKRMDSKYKWDVAPLPQYKEYNTDGDITVHGIEAGHSGSVALCINAKSIKKNAAWIFAEYIGGRTGQAEQAKSGFAIPSQIDLAKSEVFLQTNKNPKNSIVFVRAAEHQTPADWLYLKDKEWTLEWAGTLNGDVRNGKMTLAQFENDPTYTKTWELLKNYTKKQ